MSTIPPVPLPPPPRLRPSSVSRLYLRFAVGGSLGLLQLASAAALIAGVRCETCPVAVRLAIVQGAVWAAVMGTVAAWLGFGLLLGSVLWACTAVLVLWALAALGGVVWWEAALALAAGPVSHLFLVRQQRRRLMEQEALDTVEEELTARRAALAQAHQAAAGLRKRLDRYSALQSVAERLNTFVAVEPMARWIVEQTFALIGKSDVCLLFVVDTQSQGLSLVASQRADRQASVHAKRGDVIDQWVLRSRRPVLVDDAQKDFRFPREVAPERAFRSVIAAPVTAGANVLGVVRLDSAQPSAYTQDDLRFLDVLLELCAVALANARLMEETQHLALTDGLTGLALRRAFLEQWERELAASRRLGRPISLLMMDIDHFKAYNDALGHVAGDLVLQGVARLLQVHSPPDGVVARYGGEEFIVMLPGLDRAQAHAVAERMRQAIAEQPFVLRRVQTHVTVSVGAAQSPGDGLHPEDVLHAADTRLYQAKTQGRNRTCST